MTTEAKDRVLAQSPQAVAVRYDARHDWAIFVSSYSLDLLGYGTTEDDAWRDAEARLREKKARA